ncbi:hypothetical protein [Bradyrhizobium canariense]|uniref:hypothetical protein n=1 Tax=Bradyrhizobium canariense TaxID=255045 RepID=UPI0011779E85|nr:hypothetical protein [Bradyrhizobium canariense]
MENSSSNWPNLAGARHELERKNPDAGYSPENCTLICYYCNNDKSYVYSEDEYRQFFAPARARHFDYLANNLPSHH